MLQRGEGRKASEAPGVGVPSSIPLTQWLLCTQVRGGASGGLENQGVNHFLLVGSA